MIGRTNAGVGGGGLNFKVVGGTVAPSNPKENMIWVNTANEITSWIFSGTQPTNPTEGMVWISTGTSSNVAFSATKKNGIIVYPISAKQYINGALVDKDAKIYQNGAWVVWWNGEIYQTGIFYVPFVKTDSANLGGYTTTNSAGKTKGSVTFNTSEIYLHAYENPGGDNSIQFFGTNEKIDMSRFSKLNVQFNSISICDQNSELNWIMISASQYKNFPGNGTGAAYKQLRSNASTSGVTTHTIDISAIDSAYIVITAHQYTGGFNTNARIAKIWLE